MFRDTLLFPEDIVDLMKELHPEPEGLRSRNGLNPGITFQHLDFSDDYIIAMCNDQNTLSIFDEPISFPLIAACCSGI
jgi:hypothetical protein